MIDYTSPLLLDGAMGTYLWQLYQQKCTQESIVPVFEDFLQLNHDDLLPVLYRHYHQVGCMAFKSHTFNLGNKALAAQWDSSKLTTYCHHYAQILVDSVPTGINLASIGPLYGSNHSDYKEVYSQMLCAFQQSLVAVFYAETFVALAQIKALMSAFEEKKRLLTKPLWMTIVLHEDYPLRLLDGTLLSDLMDYVQSLPPEVLPRAFGLNCMSLSSPDLISAALRQIHDYFPSMPLLLLPNLGIPEEGLEYHFDEKEMLAALSKITRSCSLWGVGGCCGTTPFVMEKIKFLFAVN